MSLRSAAILFICSTGLFGCNAQLLERDQRDMRSSLLTLYEDQTMDNLIRSYNYLPVVQIDYGTLTGTQVNTAKGALDASRTSSGGATNAVQRVLGLSELSNEQQMTLNVTGEPFRDPKMYVAFKEFANDPNTFVISADKPPTAHLIRHVGDKYYYIPNTPHAKEAFFKLYLYVTFDENNSASKSGAFLDNILSELRQTRQSNQAGR